MASPSTTSSSSPAKMSFSELPDETVEEILLLCDPLDVGAVSQTNKMFSALINNSFDGYLWRQLYLGQSLDDPRTCITPTGHPASDKVDWRKELQGVVRARTVVSNGLGRSMSDAARCEVLRTLIKLVTHVPPLSTPNSKPGNMALNMQWVHRLFQQSGWNMIDPAWIDWKVSFEERQLRSHLHCYLGFSVGDLLPGARVASRAFVYNLQNYTFTNDFGPFLDNEGKVDWYHLQLILHDMSLSVRDMLPQGVPNPMGMEATQPIIPPELDLSEENDWAGVAGVWFVSFCFCDHRELIRYNASVVPGGGLDASIFSEPDFIEVFRSLKSNLVVMSADPNPKYPDRPTLRFVGVLNDPRMSTISGVVKMTDEGQVRWKFLSGDPGGSIWSSEGVEIGGVRSTLGVLGVWTTMDHQRDDPVGPFWLRRDSKRTGDLPRELLT